MLRIYLNSIVLILLTLISVDVLAQDATEIVRKSDANLRGESSEVEIVMTIVRPSWQRAIAMKSWSKGTDYSLITIQSPARDAGSAFLKRKNEIWNWVPNIGRTIKLPPSMMMQSWMGSDFTNDDLVRESSVVLDYTHKLIGDSTLAGRPVHIIEMVPKPDAAVVWGRVVVYITKTDFLQLRSEFYDENDNLINIMNGSEIKTFDGRSVPSRMEMIPVDKPGHKTILEYKSMTFNKRIDDNFFSVANMRRVQ